ncbi:MAG: hypothetical protein ACYCZK_05830 [Microbacteriaceae bacterium]
MEAYRRAGNAAYDDLSSAEGTRRELAVAGTDLWSTGPGQATQLLCTWNAFALQTLGDQFIEADYAADPSTVGFLPPVTAEQAARFLGEVQRWSAFARRGTADAQFDLSAQMALPASLPPWVEVDPCPIPHLSAMLAAGTSMREHLEAALADFNRAGIPEKRKPAATRLQGMLADADSAVSYAESMRTPGSNRVVHERVEVLLRRGIDAYYRIGQLLAQPALLDRPEVQVATIDGPSLPLPGQPGFDPWSLTDPTTRASWQHDPAARRAVDNLWRMDPDPAATLTIQAQIDAAAQAGLIAVGVDAQGSKMGNYYCCPWSPINYVRKPVTIAGRTLRPGDEFVFDVSAEEMLEGGSFKRELLVGPFHPTDEIDYCDPSNG